MSQGSDSDTNANPTVINAQYANAYAEDHARAAKTAECPFCEDLRSRPQVVLHRTSDGPEGWFTKALPEKWRLKTMVTDYSPVEGTPAEATYLLIPNRHLVWPSELQSADWSAIGQLFQWAREEFKIPGGGVAMRFDDPGNLGYSGRTVCHVHFHLIVPPAWPADHPNPRAQKALPIYFPIG